MMCREAPRGVPEGTQKVESEVGHFEKHVIPSSQGMYVDMGNSPESPREVDNLIYTLASV